jgi:hypothetical protein
MPFSRAIQKYQNCGFARLSVKEHLIIQHPKPTEDGDSVHQYRSRHHRGLRVGDQPRPRSSNEEGCLLRCMSPEVAHSCPGRVRRHVCSWQKPTPHDGCRLRLERDPHRMRGLFDVDEVIQIEHNLLMPMHAKLDN